MRVGILELLLDTVNSEHANTLFARVFRRRLYSIMPQVISVWCRSLGHQVHYATYYGQCDPADLLPTGLDYVFISTYTQASALAHALGLYYRLQGTVTVAGGPHAKAFPDECQRFFDIVVGDCNKELIDDILSGRVDPPAIVSGRSLTEFPTVEERLPEIAVSVFNRGRATRLSLISILASTGCPYECDFCSDWNTAYRAVPSERLSADLNFISGNFPGTLVAYHDPNFAVRFDETMDVIESIPPDRRNSYVMESSLSILKDSRLERLRRTRCAFVAPGVESWGDYGNKAGTRSLQGQAKLESIVTKFARLHEYVPGLQANLLFGTDLDRGDEPAELTKEFMRRLPYVWPGVNIPTPYGGTPLYERYLEQGRILPEMPVSLYFAPYLVTTLKHYNPLEYYAQLISIYEVMTSRRMLANRLRARAPIYVRLAHILRTLSMRKELAEQRRVHHMLATDRDFRSFHEGQPVKLPEFYHNVFEQQLGRYASLIPRQDRAPLPRPRVKQHPAAAAAG